MNLGLGFIPDPIGRERLRADVRAMACKVTAPFSAPPLITHRDWYRVESQGPTNSCAGNAKSGCGEVLHKIATGNVVQFSRWMSYLFAQKMSGLLGSDQGAYIWGALKAMEEIGFAPEDKYPFPKPRAPYDPTIPPAAIISASSLRVRRHAEIPDYDAAFEWIASGVGVIEIGIPWYDSFRQSTGVMDNMGGKLWGFHALAAVGYSDRRDAQGYQLIEIANSHDTTWGDGGWGYMTQRCWNRCRRDKNTEMWGVTDLSSPTPRPVNIGRAIG